jgi:type IV secretory pathway VirB9-like protein
MKRLVLLLPLLVLGACSSDLELAKCAGPVWSANPAQSRPAVYDDGASTFFHFLGSERIPTIKAVAPDHHETIVPWTMDTATRTVVVHQTAPEWHLRDGHSVLCLYNRHYDDVGVALTSRTINPDVIRVLR